MPTVSSRLASHRPRPSSLFFYFLSLQSQSTRPRSRQLGTAWMSSSILPRPEPSLPLIRLPKRCCQCPSACYRESSAVMAMLWALLETSLGSRSDWRAVRALRDLYSQYESKLGLPKEVDGKGVMTKTRNFYCIWGSTYRVHITTALKRKRGQREKHQSMRAEHVQRSTLDFATPKLEHFQLVNSPTLVSALASLLF
jgi:hypothetical protein